VFEPHFKEAEDGTWDQNLMLFKGSFRYNPKFRDRAYVTLEGVTTDIKLEGQTNMNRAFDGDLVLVKLDQPSKWKPLENGKAG